MLQILWRQPSEVPHKWPDGLKRIKYTVTNELNLFLPTALSKTMGGWLFSVVQLWCGVCANHDLKIIVVIAVTTKVNTHKLNFVHINLCQ